MHILSSYGRCDWPRCQSHCQGRRTAIFLVGLDFNSDFEPSMAAGAEVIAENIRREGDINPMVPGRKMVAIFGFCDIRRFTDATEVLQVSGGSISCS